MVKHDKVSAKTFFKRLIRSILISLFVWILFHLVATWVLMKVHHFENYVSIVSWVITIATSFVLAFTQNRELLSTFLSASVFSVLLLPVAIFVGGDQIVFIMVLLRALVFIASACIFSAFLQRLKEKKRRKNNFVFKRKD